VRVAGLHLGVQQTLASNGCNATKRIISGIVCQDRKSCGDIASRDGTESLFSLSLSLSLSLSSSFLFPSTIADRRTPETGRATRFPNIPQHPSLEGETAILPATLRGDYRGGISALEDAIHGE